eukprot:6206296-Pleurochrysis_carterae.AAC.3
MISRKIRLASHGEIAFTRHASDTYRHLERVLPRYIYLIHPQRRRAAPAAAAPPKQSSPFLVAAWRGGTAEWRVGTAAPHCASGIVGTDGPQHSRLLLITTQVSCVHAQQMLPQEKMSLVRVMHAVRLLLLLLLLIGGTTSDGLRVRVQRVVWPGRGKQALQLQASVDGVMLTKSVSHRRPLWPPPVRPCRASSLVERTDRATSRAALTVAAHVAEYACSGGACWPRLPADSAAHAASHRRSAGMH